MSKKLNGSDRSTKKLVSFDDLDVKSFVIRFYKECFNVDLILNTKTGKIDLLFKTNLKSGVETERGGRIGNLWKHKDSFNRGGLDFITVNMPQRKEKYFYPEFEYINSNGNKVLHTEPYYNENVFVRTNTNFTQVIIVKSETVRNKSYRNWFKTNSVSTGEIEEWLSFKREDVDTYNFINGKWVLDVNHDMDLPTILSDKNLQKKRLKEISEKLRKNKNV